MKPATTNGQYTGIFGGTSAAAPHVTGIAVYIRSIFPNLAPSEVKDIIEQTADKVYGMQGQNFHNEYGYGRVNAYRAVQMAQYMFDNDIDFIHSGNVSGTISENSLLAGEVTISSNLQVASGTELHIYKGASIKVSADKAILVYGDIIATGTSTDPILFSSTTPGGDQWWGVEINSGASITARYTTFDNMERGVWVDNASSDSPNNNGSVNTSYQADDVLGMGPGSLPKGSSFEDLFAFYQQARLFEEDSLYLDAVALYDSIIINDDGDESTLLYAAMIGIERCYRSLDLEGAFIEKMDAFIAQYPDNLISTVANYMAGGALARIESLDESIARLETSIIEYGEFEGMEEQEAWALFDVGQVTEIIEESESGLGKASRVKNQLLNDYPASEAAEVLRDLLGKDSSRYSERLFRIGSAFPIFTNSMRFFRHTFLRPKRPILVTIILVGLGLSTLFGQNDISIRGQVIDGKTSMVLPGVNIQIQRNSVGTTSDLDGLFQFKDLPSGSYQITFSMMGYAPYTSKDVRVTQGIPVELMIELKLNNLASPQVVVTSSRKAQDILESPFSVSAIGRREIQAKAVIKMVDILSYESGVSTVKGQLNIRGASGYSLGAGSRSLLLIDGIPMMGSAGGNVTWATVPTSEVDRVEIVKSGGSAMYGSSAMGGVVNIITRNAAPETETRISTQIGLYSEPRLDQWKWRESRGILYNSEISHSQRLGDHSAWIRIQKRRDDGFMELNWEEALNVSGKLKLNFGNAHSAALFVNVLDDKNGLLSTWKSPADPFEAPVGSHNDYSDGVKTVINGHYNYVFSPDLAFKVRGSGYWNSWESFGADPGYSNESRYFGELQTSRNWTKKLSSVAGLSTQQNGVEAQIFGEHESHSLAAYVLTQQKISQLTFSMGGRWETYAVDGDRLDQVFSPQLAINWKPVSWMGLRISTGKGFRVPTVAEMFTRARRSIFVVEPNPDLISETSVSRELGATLLVGQLGKLDLIKLDMAIFHNKFDNLIEPVPDSLAIIHFQNISDARILGMDIGLGLSLYDNFIDFKTAYTWLDPVELNEAGEVMDTLSYRYRHHWVSTVGVHLWDIDASVEYRYASKLESVELFSENLLTGQDKQVPIHIWNAGLGTSYQDWNFLFRVENIFQYYYTQLEQNMEEERVFTLTVERQL